MKNITRKNIMKQKQQQKVLKVRHAQMNLPRLNGITEEPKVYQLYSYL